MVNKRKQAYALAEANVLVFSEDVIVTSTVDTEINFWDTDSWLQDDATGGL